VTGNEWLVDLKFRVAKRTFSRERLIAALDLKPLNDLPDLPVYGSEPRVKCKNLRGPWQEVQLRVHSLDEIDRPEFWKFVEEAVAGFQKFTTRAQENPEDIMPWKVLGRKWHLARRGFPPGKKIAWETEVLEELCEVLSDAAPGGQFLWNNQQVVNVFVPGQTEAWASIYTKRPAAIDLSLTGPRGRFALGRIANLGVERGLQSDRNGKEQVKLRFCTLEDLQRGDLREFVKEHLASLSEAVASR
jgi:excinuclease ABC subunit A